MTGSDLKITKQKDETDPDLDISKATDWEDIKAEYEHFLADLIEVLHMHAKDKFSERELEFRHSWPNQPTLGGTLTLYRNKGILFKSREEIATLLKYFEIRGSSDNPSDRCFYIYTELCADNDELTKAVKPLSEAYWRKGEYVANKHHYGYEKLIGPITATTTVNSKIKYYTFTVRWSIWWEKQYYSGRHTRVIKKGEIPEPPPERPPEPEPEPEESTPEPVEGVSLKTRCKLRNEK